MPPLRERSDDTRSWPTFPGRPLSRAQRAGSRASPGYARGAQRLSVPGQRSRALQRHRAAVALAAGPLIEPHGPPGAPRHPQRRRPPAMPSVAPAAASARPLGTRSKVSNESRSRNPSSDGMEISQAATRTRHFPHTRCATASKSTAYSMNWSGIGHRGTTTTDGWSVRILRKLLFAPLDLA